MQFRFKFHIFEIVDSYLLFALFVLKIQKSNEMNCIETEDVIRAISDISKSKRFSSLSHLGIFMLKF